MINAQEVPYPLHLYRWQIVGPTVLVHKKGYGSKSKIQRWHANQSEEVVSECPVRQKAGRVLILTQKNSGTFEKSKRLFLILLRTHYLLIWNVSLDLVSDRRLSKSEDDSKWASCGWLHPELLRLSFKVASYQKYHINIFGLKGMPFNHFHMKIIYAG